MRKKKNLLGDGQNTLSRVLSKASSSHSLSLRTLPLPLSRTPPGSLRDALGGGGTGWCGGGVAGEWRGRAFQAELAARPTSDPGVLDTVTVFRKRDRDSFDGGDADGGEGFLSAFCMTVRCRWPSGE